MAGGGDDPTSCSEDGTSESESIHNAARWFAGARQAAWPPEESPLRLFVTGRGVGMPQLCHRDGTTSLGFTNGEASRGSKSARPCRHRVILFIRRRIFMLEAIYLQLEMRRSWDDFSSR